MNIAVFASHGGSDMQAIVDGCKNGLIKANVVVVISNNADSMALERAKRVLEIEHTFLVEVVNDIVTGEIKLGK